MLRVKLLVACGSLGFCTIASAQDYFDFGDIPGVPDRPAVQVDLDPTLLGIAGSTVATENPAAAELLAGIDGIRVRVYKTLDDIADVIEFIDDVSARLERDNWQQVVSIQDDGNARLFVQVRDESITGITAMVVHDNEAVFVNVAGTINPEQLANTLNGFGGNEMLASLGELDFNNL